MRVAAAVFASTCLLAPALGSVSHTFVERSAFTTFTVYDPTAAVTTATGSPSSRTVRGTGGFGETNRLDREVEYELFPGSGIYRESHYADLDFISNVSASQISASGSVSGTPGWVSSYAGASARHELVAFFDVTETIEFSAVLETTPFGSRDLNNVSASLRESGQGGSVLFFATDDPFGPDNLRQEFSGLLGPGSYRFEFSAAAGFLDATEGSTFDFNMTFTPAPATGAVLGFSLLGIRRRR